MKKNCRSNSTNGTQNRMNIWVSSPVKCGHRHLQKYKVGIPTSPKKASPQESLDIGYAESTSFSPPLTPLRQQKVLLSFWEGPSSGNDQESAHSSVHKPSESFIVPITSYTLSPGWESYGDSQLLTTGTFTTAAAAEVFPDAGVARRAGICRTFNFLLCNLYLCYLLFFFSGY